MKTCKPFEKQLTAYIHGELEEEHARLLEQHLEDCASCRSEYTAQQAALSLLGDALEAAPAPQALRAGRNVRRHEDAPKLSWVNIWFTPQFKSALAAGVIAVCFIVFSGMFVVFTVMPRYYHVAMEAPVPQERPAMQLKKPKLALSRQPQPRPSSRLIAPDQGRSMRGMQPADSVRIGDRFAGVSAMDEFNTEQYDWLQENDFLTSMDNPLSTFSIDVDRAAYANVRRFLNDNRLPPPDAVRIEEMINYFNYDYPEPEGEDPFTISMEVAECPWNGHHQLAMIGLQGLKIDTADLPPNNLVFLLDVSGSMNSPDKLPLLKSALQLLVDQLRPQDRVSIVVYASATGLVLPPTSDKASIEDAINNLQAGGSTAGGAGLVLAYKTAKDSFIKNGNNRVILATDGDFNVGVSSDGELVRMIEERRSDGIYLSVLGFGTGNLKDSKMEKLADRGNGNYAYIDDILEAKKTLVNEMGGTLLTIAKDVKIQVEFNPAKVKAYRLIGYENRILANQDFDDDSKDAGELGAGHAVTAFYELIPAGARVVVPSAAELKYQKAELVDSDELMTVKLRYKQPDSAVSRLLVQSVSLADYEQSRPSENFCFASEVAEFGLLLRNSEFKGNASYGKIIERAKASRGDDTEGYRAEFIRLVEKARLIDAAGERQ